ncbi:hypothetical protein [Hymenobacter terrenus]|uniref:hypothetical protein n=1 Tax=Hymenobacter terrenus TaxID=1629124 RepID=UPI0006195471|nr:hypothetical protein [Hymenobacter terrenus]
MPFRLPISFLIVVALAGLLGTGCVRKQFFQPDARPDSVRSQPLPASADSVRGATAGRQYARHGKLYGALVGQHHRRTWGAPVTVPVLQLATAQPGGLRPGKIGGGFNSTSLGLTATGGPGYVLRTVDKDPRRATPRWLRGTFLVNVLRDNVSATNPYAALAVPPLAQAVGVPFTSPRLFYVRPDDPAFQRDSLRLFRGQLALLEEKAAVPVGRPGLKRAAVVGSDVVFAALFASLNNRLDQPALLQARLLDGWLGDWDRHPGQWNWTVNKQAQAGITSYYPLPKDRDMVFYRLDDGALGWFIGHVALPHWATFGPRFGKAAHLLSSGKYLDVRGLNSLTRAQFQAAALAMQQRLPDSLISRAVRRLPPAAFALEGPRLIAALQARRAALPRFATDFYQLLARNPRLGGTAQAERFEVHRYADSTVVAIYPAKTAANDAAPPPYRRTFFPGETRVIQLEGLGGEDVFVVTEHAAKPVGLPRLRLYGGPGTDEFSKPQNSKGLRFSQDSAPAKQAYDQLPKE